MVKLTTEMNGNFTLITVFIRIFAGAIIYFEADFPQNMFSIFEKLYFGESNYSSRLVIDICTIAIKSGIWDIPVVGFGMTVLYRVKHLVGKNAL